MRVVDLLDRGSKAAHRIAADILENRKFNKSIDMKNIFIRACGKNCGLVANELIIWFILHSYKLD